MPGALAYLEWCRLEGARDEPFSYDHCYGQGSSANAYYSSMSYSSSDDPDPQDFVRAIPPECESVCPIGVCDFASDGGKPECEECRVCNGGPPACVLECVMASV